MNDSHTHYTLTAPRDCIANFLRNVLKDVVSADEFDIIDLDFPDLSIHFVILEDFKYD